MKKKIIAAVVLSSALATPVFASTDVGPYVGLGIGQSSTDTYNLSTKTATAFSIYAGYQFMKYVAAEVQYNDFGSPTATGGSSFKIDGYSVAAVGTLPLNDQWALQAKLGYAATKLGSPINNTKNDIVYGIGGQFSATQNWGVRLAYDMYSVETPAPAQKATTSVLWISGLYRF